jgi:tetratricopeptide (TPR) repeat protein
MKTTTKKMSRWMLAAAATLLLACTTMAREAPRREWYQDYEEALRAIEKDNPRKAVTLLGAALAREPRAGLLRADGNRHIRYAPQFWLGVAYHRLGDCARAVASFDRSRADDETAKAPALAARLQTLRRECEQRIGPTQAPRTAVALDPAKLEVGVRAYLAGDLVSAVRAFDELARAVPDSVAPHLLLGMALHGQWSAAGELDASLLERARRELARAAAIDPAATPDPALYPPEVLALYRSLR